MRRNPTPNPIPKGQGGRALEQLRALIPTMLACDHCGDCCGGRLAANEEEYRQIETYAKERGLKYQFYGDYTCGWYDREAKGCRIYPVRPLICRLFGVDKKFPCPKRPAATQADLPSEMLRERYQGPWYMLNGYLLGLLEDQLPWEDAYFGVG